VIGGQYAAMESSSEPTWLAEKMSILSISQPLLPLSQPELPTIPYSIAEKGTSRGFVLKGVELSVEAPLLVKTGCMGRLCDCRVVNSQNTCSCYQMDRNTGKCHVLVMDVTIIADDLVDTLVATNWSSLRFTEMGFSSPLPSDVNEDSYQVTATVCQKFSALVDYINSHVGWTVMGWHCRGVARDASASGADDTQLLSEKSTLHFEMITPTTATKEALAANNCVCNTAILGVI